MAALIPLLLPQVVDAGVKLGIGISNAIQGDSSTVSFQIGRKVFSNKKRFNFGSLPPELRAKIILMAMEASKDLIMPAPYFFDYTQPPTDDQLRELRKQNPLNPESSHYRSVVGDRVSANGYPISTWRWATISTEWRDIMRARLWKRVELLGRRPYLNLLERMRSKEGFEVLRNAHAVILREGFRTPDDLYAILLSPLLENVNEISILPDYPTPFHQFIDPVRPFDFGLQLVRTRKPAKVLMYGMPLERTTNVASRQQLKTLAAPALHLTFFNPSYALFKELKDLVSETTRLLTIRYLPLRDLALPQLFLCEPLQSFRRIHLYLNLPRPRLVMTGPEGGRSLVEDPESPVSLFVAQLLSALEEAPVDVQDRYSIWNVEGWETSGQVQKATKKRIWPTEVLFSSDFDDAAPKVVEEEESGEDQDQSGTVKQDRKYWERETDLKLFGGLLNLRLESKRH